MKLCSLRPLLIVLLLCPFAISESLLAAADELDCRFTTGGTLQLDFGSNNSVIDVALQSDGKIVALGSEGVVSGGGSLRLSRFLVGGTLDPDFGVDGTVVHSFAGLSPDGALAIDRLDRIVVVGTISVGGDPEAFVALFTATGSVWLGIPTSAPTIRHLRRSCSRTGDWSLSTMAPGPAVSALWSMVCGVGGSCVAPLVTGSGFCMLAPAVIGTRDLVATYASNGNFTGSLGTKAHEVLGFDFGDAPATFPTLAADDGARHTLGPGLFFGSSVDPELDGQPSALALGDDAMGDDEDGVAFSGPGGAISVTVSVQQGGLLDAWVDFNGDGSWDEDTERVFTAEALSPGTNALTLNLPATAVTETVVTRFRLSSA